MTTYVALMMVISYSNAIRKYVVQLYSFKSIHLPEPKTKNKQTDVCRSDTEAMGVILLTLCKKACINKPNKRLRSLLTHSMYKKVYTKAVRLIGETHEWMTSKCVMVLMVELTW